MRGIVKIPPAEFRALATRPAEQVEFYGYDNPLLRETFWRRLTVMARLLERYAPDHSCCLDLGTGSGVFLPTLAARFESVIAVDNEISEAANLVEARSLGNVVLRQGDVFAQPFRRGQFRAIVAADVLEHFPDTQPIAALIVDWLADDGIVVTSVPTENALDARRPSVALRRAPRCSMRPSPVSSSRDTRA